MEIVKILIGDNNKTERLLIQSALQEFRGVKVEVTDNGRELLKAINETTRVVVLEFSMPGYQGVDLVKKIRQKNDDVFIIILTAETNAEIITELQGLRIFSYIIKSNSALNYLKWIVEKTISILTTNSSKKHV